MAEQVHLRGWLDTRQNIIDTFNKATDPLIKQRITRSMTVVFDKTTKDVAENSKMALLLTYASYALNEKLPKWNKRAARMPSMDHILAVSIGELIADDVLPPHYFLNTVESNARVEQCIKYYLGHETPLNRGKKLEDFIQTNNTQEVTQRMEDWAEIGPNATVDSVFETHAVAYSSFLLAADASNDQHLGPIELFTTLFIAVAKRGVVSDDFMAKLERSLKDDLQHTSRLSSNVIQLVYKFYGAHITANNAQQILQTWLNEIPQNAIRFRLTLTQSVNSGLTAFIVVGRAMSKYPNFPWGKLNALTGGELMNYKNALVQVAGNPYYGFNKSLGCVRSTLYSSIAYVAKELLIQINGETSLKRYAGWVRSPKNALVIKNMIDVFKANYTANLESVGTPVMDQALAAEISTVIGQAENKNLFV